jgi:hypothetical protein
MARAERTAAALVCLVIRVLIESNNSVVLSNFRLAQKACQSASVVSTAAMLPPLAFDRPVFRSRRCRSELQQRLCDRRNGPAQGHRHMRSGRFRFIDFEHGNHVFEIVRLLFQRLRRGRSLFDQRRVLLRYFVHLVDCNGNLLNAVVLHPQMRRQFHRRYRRPAGLPASHGPCQQQAEFSGSSNVSPARTLALISRHRHLRSAFGRLSLFRKNNVSCSA